MLRLRLCEELIALACMARASGVSNGDRHVVGKGPTHRSAYTENHDDHCATYPRTSVKTVGALRRTITSVARHSFRTEGRANEFPFAPGLSFLPLVSIAWYFTKGLDIDPGLTLAAWLFPLMAAAGPLVGWVLLQGLASRFIFNQVHRRLEFRCLRFCGLEPIPLRPSLPFKCATAVSRRSVLRGHTTRYQSTN